MKPVIILLAVFIYGITGETADEWNQRIFVAAGKCKADNNIDDETFKALIKDSILPDTPNGKCFVGCIMENLGFVKDGKISFELMVKETKNLYQKPEDFKKVQNIYELCIKKGDADNLCEAGYSIALCSITELEKVGLHIH